MAGTESAAGLSQLLGSSTQPLAGPCRQEGTALLLPAALNACWGSTASSSHCALVLPRSWSDLPSTPQMKKPPQWFLFLSQLSLGVFTAFSMCGLSADREISSASCSRGSQSAPWAVCDRHRQPPALPRGTVLCQGAHPAHPALPLSGWFCCLGWDTCSGRNQTGHLGR